MVCKPNVFLPSPAERSPNTPTPQSSILPQFSFLIVPPGILSEGGSRGRIPGVYPNLTGSFSLYKSSGLISRASQINELSHSVS